MRWMLVCAVLACGGSSRTVSVEPAALPTAQPTTARAVTRPSLPVGEYAFDVDATVEHVETDYASLPLERQQRVDLLVGMLHKTRGTMTVGADHQLTLVTRMGDADEIARRGTWHFEDNDIVLVFDHLTLRCGLDGASIVCDPKQTTAKVFTRR